MKHSVRSVDMPMQTRLAPITSVDEETRTVELCFSAGGLVKRYDWSKGIYYMEELSLQSGHVRMSRLENGAPLLDAHNRWSLRDVMGVVEPGTAKVDGKRGTAKVRFSKREEVEPIFRDVKDKIITNVSTGYATYRIEQLPPDSRSEGLPIYRAIDWEPMEISLVPIGADAGAGVRAEQQRSFPCEIIDSSTTADPATQRKEASMTPEEQRAADEAAAKKRVEDEARQARERKEAEDRVRTEELSRVQGIRELCSVHKLDRAFEDTLIGDSKMSLEGARAAVLTELAKKSTETEVRSGVDITIVTDEVAVRRSLMTNALLHRANNIPGIKLEDGAKQFRGYTLRELMRKCLELRGLRTEGMTVNQMWERTFLSGSDLPNVVLDAANKSLRAAYEASPRTFVPWTRKGTAPDFKNINRIALSGAPSLLEVKSGGEFKKGIVSDGKETYALATYGRILGINRQTIINDDMDAFTRLPMLCARAAADLESDTVYGIVTANAALADGVALFSATTHVNYTSSGTAISVDSLGVGRAAMRKQTGIEGRPINVRPRFLIVPVAKEGLAEQYTSPAYQAAISSSINPFAAGGRNPLEPIAEPRLDANSATAWYLAADPAQIDTIEYSYLEGEEGVYMESRMGWEIDGIELKTRLDFASKALDYRGLYKNAGA